MRGRGNSSGHRVGKTKKGGPPRQPDRERYPSGRAKALDDYAKASPHLLARRAALINPEAVKAVLADADGIKSRARAAAKDRGETLSRPGEEEAVIDAIAACISPNEATCIETALGRYYFAARLSGPNRLSAGEHSAGMIYATIHGTTWSGVRGDIERAFGDSDSHSDLGVTVTQTRRLRTHLARHTVSTLAADLDPRPDLTPAEEEERRRRLWARYREAREILVKLGHPVLAAVEELVIEDRDPWWVAPEPDRLRPPAWKGRETQAETTERVRLEEAARLRARRVTVARNDLHRGLAALAGFFNTRDQAAPTTAAVKVAKVAAIERAEDAALGETARPPERRVPRPRLAVDFYRGEVGIDKTDLATAVARLLGRSPLPKAA